MRNKSADIIDIFSFFHGRVLIIWIYPQGKGTGRKYAAGSAMKRSESVL